MTSPTPPLDDVVEVDAETGKATRRKLTADELAQRDRDRADAAARRAAEAARVDPVAALHAAIRAASTLDQLKAALLGESGGAGQVDGRGKPGGTP